MAGRFWAVVGPSGVGKDSVMQAVAARRSGLRLVRRVITRPRDAGGEVFDSVDAVEFARREAAGEFVLSWRAHGLSYGIPARYLDELAAGRDLLANLSRSVLEVAQARLPGFGCILLSAPPEVLADRLAGRGREDAREIARRLARAGYALPPGSRAVEVDNSGALDDSARAVLAILDGMADVGQDAEGQVAK